MKDLYEVAGLSKQALHQHRNRALNRDQKSQELFDKADKIRKEHPGCGCRKMARQLSCRGWGRDKIEELLLGSGYRVFYRRRFKKTTDHRKGFYYPNLIEGMELDHISQVVQTDITYYRIGEKFYYLVFLIDVYSRRIVGHAVSKYLHAQANLMALQRMLRLRGYLVKDLIHHSDRGSQYIDKEYRKLLADQGIQPSMCVAGWENAYTERINRTIKEEYLDYWEIKDYRSLSYRLGKAVNHYNNQRPHSSLKYQTPVAFENYVNNLSIANRPKLMIYKHLPICSQHDCE